MKAKYPLSEKDLEDTIELDKRMVEIPTVSPEGEHYEDYIRFVDSELKRRVRGIETEVIEVPGSAYERYPEFRSRFIGRRLILIGRLSAPGKPKAYLNGHYDVVEAGDLQNELVGAILAVKQRYQIDCTFRVDPILPPLYTPEDDANVRRVRETAAEEEELFPVACSMGSNNIAWVRQELGLPTFSRGVQREGCNVHGYNENVPVDNLRIGVVDLVEFLGR